VVGGARLARYEFLYAFFKFAARQQNAALTGIARHANVRAEPHDRPFVTAARMRFTQAHHIL